MSPLPRLPTRMRTQRATIGVAVIGSDGRVLNSLLDRIVDFMDSLGLAEIVSHETELIPLGG